MPQAKSIHIGLNFVDPNAYNGWNGELSGCINDANSMEAVAQSLGYQTQKLIDSQATSHNVIAAIAQAATQMTAGDILMVTYSGHGGQVFDASGDDSDGMDETWCLWDRQIIDDELYALWRQFAEKVRIVLISDSCHSGTVARLMAADAFEQRARSSGASAHTSRPKALDPEVQAQLASRDWQSYNTFQWLAGDPRTGDMRASLILISGCQDNQLSYDGDQNGRFTGTLLSVWANGGFTGDYRAFHQQIGSLMPANQTPNYYLPDGPEPEFECQRAFSIAPPPGWVTGATPQPIPPVPAPPVQPTPFPPPTPQPMPQPTPVPAAGSRPTLRRGDRGAHVVEMQQRLIAHGASLDADGDFGFQSESALKQFQSKQGLSVDGVCGDSTWAKLLEPVAPGTAPPQPWPPAPAPTPAPTPTPPPAAPTTDQPTWSASEMPMLRRGDRGDAVRTLQERLIHFGHQLVADGAFGPGTEQEVKSFQRNRGLMADGIVGHQTWESLREKSMPTTRGVPGVGSAPDGYSRGTGAGVGYPGSKEGPRSAMLAEAPSLGVGDRGEHVRRLQSLLNKHGYRSELDGEFTQFTASLLRSFQSAHKLAISGRTDAETWAALEKA